MQKVNEVEPSANTLEEAKERVTQLMKKRNGKEYDFDARLEKACEEVRKAEQKAYKENAKRQIDILSYVELYSIKRNLNSIGNNLFTTP